MSFALRGAPCGDDAHLTLCVGGDDHEQQPTSGRLADDDRTRLCLRVAGIRPSAGVTSKMAHCQRIESMDIVVEGQAESLKDEEAS
jgi:hypothetical protein